MIVILQPIRTNWSILNGESITTYSMTSRTKSTPLMLTSNIPTNSAKSMKIGPRGSKGRISRSISITIERRVRTNSRIQRHLILSLAL